MPTVEHSAIKGPSLTPSEEHQQAPSDLMKNNRRYSNVVEDADHDDVASVLPTPRENDHDHFNKLMMDASPSQSCNASQNLMKSLMKSYNAGNVQFYENLHQKYFAKAKAGIDDKPCDPPSALLDMTDDGAVDRSAISKADEISRFMADSRLNEGSRSRSRSRGANTSNNLGLASKISSVNMAAFSQLKGTSSKNEGFHTVKELDQQTQGAHTGDGLDDDTHLFELTEKSNNTYMHSYWNQTSNTGNPSSLHHHNHISTTVHPVTQGATPEQTQRGTPMITEACQEENETNPSHKLCEDDSSNNAMSINFKNSIYSKIKFDPSVHNLAPSMISARHQQMHSDASASQISTMGLTSKMLGRNGQTYRGMGLGGSLEDAESEVPTRSFLTRQKLLSSSSSPEIDIEDVMQRRQGQQMQTRSRLGSNRGNKSVPNIHNCQDDGASQRYERQKDEMSRRDLSARFEEEGDQEVTNFELGTQRSGRNVSPPRDDLQRAHQHPEVVPQMIGFNDQTRKTDFSEKVYNLTSPGAVTNEQQAKQRIQHKPNAAEDTSSSFLKHLQNMGSPDDNNSNLSYQPHHLLKQHQFLQTEQYTDLLNGGIHQVGNTDEKHQQYMTNPTHGTTQSDIEPQTLRKDNLLMQAAGSTQKQQTMNPNELEQTQPHQIDQDQPSLLQAFQDQVKIARARLQSHSQMPVPGLTTDQQAQLIRQQFESQPAMPKSQLLHRQHDHHHQNQSVSNLDGEGHRSDFTFVLSQPTQGGFTECHNCGIANGNGSFVIDNVNGSILQSHGLRSSIGCDTSMQIRKKVLTNFYSNGMPIPPSQNNQNPHGGTASFPEGILNQGIGVNSSITNFQSAKSSEPRLNPHQFPAPDSNKLNGGLRNRLPEIAASPIYSESGGAPGRKFFMSINQNQGNGQVGGLPPMTDHRGKANHLICNSNGQLRLSQIQGNAYGAEDGAHGHGMYSDPSSPSPNDPRLQQPPQFNNFTDQHASPSPHPDSDHQQQFDQGNNEVVESGDPQNLHELFSLQQQELNHARNLLICTYDHLQRTLQQGCTPETQDEAVKLMQVIQGATMLDEGYYQQNVQQQPQQMSGQNFYGQIPEAAIIEHDEEEDGVSYQQQSHSNYDDEEVEDDQVVQDSARQQMTESEIIDDRLGQVDKVYLMPKQVQNLMLDQSTETQVQQQQTNDKNLEIKHLQSNTAKSGLKNSLLSSGAVQDHTLYDLDKETEYSFFAEESEIRPRRNNGGRKDKDKDRDGETSFIASRSPKEYKRGKARQQDEEEVDDLAQTQNQLKNEKKLNRKQADELNRMQAQIDALTRQWSITENQLRNNGAIYSMFHPNPGQTSTWHPTATSLTHQNNLTQRALNPVYSMLGGLPLQQQTQLIEKPKQSTLSEIQPCNTNTMPFSSPSLLDQPRMTTTPSAAGGFPSPFSNTHGNQRMTLPQTPQMAQAHGTSNQTNSVHSVSQHTTSAHAADQSKHLIELNERLTNQIQNNCQILDSITNDQQRQQQNQMSTMQQVQQMQLAAHHNHSLGSIDHANVPESGVQSLITLTKITAEASAQAHDQHKEEMEKLRKRQQAFTAKIDKIGSKLNPKKLQASANTSIQTKVGLKPSIRASSGSRQQTLDEQQLDRSQVDEGAGNTSSTFLDMSNDKVPTKD